MAVRGNSQYPHIIKPQETALLSDLLSSVSAGGLTSFLLVLPAFSVQFHISLSDSILSLAGREWAIHYSHPEFNLGNGEGICLDSFPFKPPFSVSDV